jgi:hypothetical protein
MLTNFLKISDKFVTNKKSNKFRTNSGQISDKFPTDFGKFLQFSFFFILFLQVFLIGRRPTTNHDHISILLYLLHS